MLQPWNQHLRILKSVGAEPADKKGLVLNVNKRATGSSGTQRHAGLADTVRILRRSPSRSLPPSQMSNSKVIRLAFCGFARPSQQAQKSTQKRDLHLLHEAKLLVQKTYAGLPRNSSAKMLWLAQMEAHTERILATFCRKLLPWAALSTRHRGAAVCKTGLKSQGLQAEVGAVAVVGAPPFLWKHS